TAARLTERYFDPFYSWTTYGRFILIEDTFETSSGEMAVGLLQVDVTDGMIRELLRVIPADDEEVSLVARRELPHSGGLIVREIHRVADDPTSNDPEFEYDPSRSKTHYIWEGGIVELGLLAEEARPLFSISPTDDWIALSLEGTEACLILSVPNEEIVFGPDARLCSVATWSTDGHLLLGRNDELDFIVFDLDTMELNVVAPELDGSKVRFLGWVPDPSVYDEIVESQLP
ncbi:MAG: hypothetical protein ACC700_10915, partial [Anaerolineales bacterium]